MLPSILHSSESYISPSLASVVLSGKESACNAGNTISLPGLGRSPGEGHGYPL